MTLRFEDQELIQARRLNRWLAWAPRFRPKNRAQVKMTQFLLVTSQYMPGLARRWAGVSAENRWVTFAGRSVRIRVLQPNRKVRGVYLDIHGGGWVVGNARMDDFLNTPIAAECGVAVVSVDYTLAVPGSIFDCIEDCAAAGLWLANHCRQEFGVEKVIIGGDSAGAHLAACTAVRMRDHGSADTLAGAILLYGMYDLGGTQTVRNAGPETLVLHGPSMPDGLKAIIPDHSKDDRRRPELSPLFADLEGLPPALFIVGHLDPLIDDSLAMHDRWQAANHNADLVLVPDTPHGFHRFRTRVADKTNRFIRQWIIDRLFW